MKTTDIVKGDTLKIREAISEAILKSQINKPITINDDVDESILDYRRRLKNFNFGNNFLENEQKKYEEIQSLKSKNKLIIDVNNYYSKIYPNNVIIPLSDMTKILKKYDLFSGQTKYYNKLIPQRNLNLIEKFWTNADKKPFCNFDLNDLSNLELNNINEIKKINDVRDDDFYYRPRRNRTSFVDTHSLQIIAPLNDFDLTKEEKVIGNYIVHDKEWDEKNIKKPAKNLDPIVWIPVKYPSVGGAALIITQWGPEADIPEFN